MTPASGGRHALIVATARYDDPKLSALRAPAADAERLAAVLADPARGAFAVQTLIDEPQGTVARRVAAFFRDRRPDDLLLLHFSCHGVKDDRGELFLAAADTEVDLLSATGVSAQWLNDQITRTRSRRTVVLLDCCFSGAFPFGLRARSAAAVDAPEQLQGRGRAIITASSAMEYAYEGDRLTGAGQPSIFTEAVVEGLETGRADLDGDHLISVDDLYNYVFDRVTERTPSQRPNRKSDLEGPLYLAAGAGGALPADPAPAAARATTASASAPSAPAASPRPRRRRPSRRVAALAAAAVLLAAGTVAGVFALTGGDGRHAVDPVTWTPDWCNPTDAPAAAEDVGAEQAVTCDVPTTLVQTDVHGGDATFARFANAAAARTALKRTWASLGAHGHEDCDEGALQELSSVYAKGRAYCLVQTSSGRAWIGFNDDNTDVTGFTTFDAPTTPLSAVDAFGRIG
jgi:Caspase domain